MRKFTLTLLFTIILVIPNAFAQTKNEGIITKFLPNLGDLVSEGRLPMVSSLSNLDSIVWHSTDEEQITKEEYSFDSNGNLTSLTSYRPLSAILPCKVEISYDESGRDTSTTTSYLMKIDEVTGKTAWVPLSKTITKYDDDGYMVEQLHYTLTPHQESKAIPDGIQHVTTRHGSDDNITWQIFKSENDSSAIRYEYNEDGNIKLIAKCAYTSNGTTGKWDDQSTSTYIYDDKNRLIEITNYHIFTSSWQNTQKLTIKYDDQSRPILADITMINHSSPLINPINLGSMQAYYKTQTAGLNKINPANINIWSNDQFIHIESESNLAYIRIYNLSGNLLYQATSKGNRSIIPSPVRRGIFLVNVKDVNGKSKTEKIRIQ